MSTSELEPYMLRAAGTAAGSMLALTPLEELTLDYRAHRRERVAAYPPAPPGVCRYCGRRRIPWANCTLDGHAKCQASVEMRRRVIAFVMRSPLSVPIIAEAIGVKEPTLRAWMRWYARA